MDLNAAIGWIKLSTKYLLAIAIATGVILFSPEKLLSTLGIASLTENYKHWVGIGFVVSMSLLLAHTAFSLFSWVRKRYMWSKNLKKAQEYLLKLTQQEIELLRGYVLSNTKTQYLSIESGIVQGLVANRIIYRSSHMGNIEEWAYNIQPWAWDYLRLNPQIILSSEELKELIENNF